MTTNEVLNCSRKTCLHSDHLRPLVTYLAWFRLDLQSAIFKQRTGQNDRPHLAYIPPGDMTASLLCDLLWNNPYWATGHQIMISSNYLCSVISIPQATRRFANWNLVSDWIFNCPFCIILYSVWIYFFVFVNICALCYSDATLGTAWVERLSFSSSRLLSCYEIKTISVLLSFHG